MAGCHRPAGWPRWQGRTRRRAAAGCPVPRLTAPEAILSGSVQAGTRAAAVPGLPLASCGAGLGCSTATHPSPLPAMPLVTILPTQRRLCRRGARAAKRCHHFFSFLKFPYLGVKPWHGLGATRDTGALRRMTTRATQLLYLGRSQPQSLFSV